MENNLEKKLKSIPKNPGIYQFKDEKGKIIYVGKAKNLRNRVRSYFQKRVESAKTKILVSKINDLEIIITDNEVEALVLENNLIKKLKPRYNINLKDDKTFPYIRVTNEPFPQIFPTRSVIKDGSKYFGPYTEVKSMKSSLRMINRLFRIRSCKYFIDDEAIKKKKIKICLDYHIKKCDGPCEGLIKQNDYNQMVEQVIKLLKGKTDDLIADLEKQMQEASQNLNFEKAAELRDKITHLQVYSQKQKIVTKDYIDRDIITLATEDKITACTILNIRSGKLIGKRNLKLTNETLDEPEKIYQSAIRFYYNEYVEIPSEIILEVLPAESDFLLEWLNSKSEKKVNFIIPKIESEKMSLLKMCKQNSLLQLKEIQLQKMKREKNVSHAVAALKRDLHLKKMPLKIECFDISNIQGSDTVASMVVFVDGKPKKSLYRRFIINSVSGPDDFASMREVIERRYSKIADKTEPLPDLIMVDGGKGQLSSAVEIINNLGVKDYQIIGLAKRLEEVFFPNFSEPQTIPKTSSSLKLLQHVRDEAHRFAITFHRQRRSKRTITTELLEINGIGSKTAENLLREIGSLEKIKSATIEELAKVVGKAKAKEVYNHYNAVK